MGLDKETVKNKYIKILLGISVFIIAFLFLYIMWLQNWCGKVHLQDIVCKSKDMVPDEETAEKIAYILVDTHLGFEESYYYDVSVRFDEKRNEWQVSYLKMTPDRKEFFGGGGFVVAIEKNTGIVTHVRCSFD